MSDKNINKSETKVVMRSEINFNPDNIKHHSEESVRGQVRNIRKNGLLGGILVNATTGNLMDGHRRVQAADIINHYDPNDPTTDYGIKVEVVEMDKKTEREQLAYMALGNSKADYNLVANFIDEIDYKNIGISEEEYNSILMLKDDATFDFPEMEIMEDVFAPQEKKQRESVTELPTSESTIDEAMTAIEEKPHMSKEEVKKEKEHCTNVDTARYDNDESYIIINFHSQETKQAFCDALGIENRNNMVIEGKDMLLALDL